MADITCNVVKDLLPLYVDDVISVDSRKIVEEHISGCENCMNYYKELKASEIDNDPVKHSGEKKTFKKIKKAINKKRFITAMLTAIFVMVFAGCLFYGIVVHEKYIPYEEAGLYVTAEAIRSDRDYYKSSGIYTPDGETLFLYMTTTAYTELKGNGIEAGWPVISLTDDALTMQTEDDSGNITLQVCREIYYIPEQNARQLMKVIKWGDGNVEEEIKNLKDASVLVWKAE